MKTLVEEIRNSLNLLEYCADSVAELAAEFKLSKRGREMLEARGNPIKHGSSRCAWNHLTDGNLVVKGEFVKGKYGAQARNKQEAKNWEFVQGIPVLKEFFAPVIEISPCDWLLFMALAEPVSETDFPTELPALFDRLDSHLGNFGKYQGRVVHIDYTEDIAKLLNEGDYLKMVPIKRWHGGNTHRSPVLDMTGVTEPPDRMARQNWRDAAVDPDWQWDPDQDEANRGL